jgi:hypothetical protein
MVVFYLRHDVTRFYLVLYRTIIGHESLHTLVDVIISSLLSLGDEKKVSCLL